MVQPGSKQVHPGSTESSGKLPYAASILLKLLSARIPGPLMCSKLLGGVL